MTSFIDQKYGLLPNPYDEEARIKAAQTLNEFVEASNDEINLLQQKAKLQWLREGDMNTTFFRSYIKAKRNKNKVKSIRDEDGNMYEGSKVSDQFVSHWGNLL
ncbi:hypothetical protein Tco_0480186, partial [Tanacetum coccineum]